MCLFAGLYVLQQLIVRFATLQDFQIEQRSIWLRESIVFAAVISAFEDIYYFVAECHPFLDYKAR